MINYNNSTSHNLLKLEFVSYALQNRSPKNDD